MYMGNDDRHERLGALTGLAAVVLFIVGFVIVFPTPPAPDAPADEVRTFYVNHQDAIRAGVAILTAGLLAFIWFLGSLSSALRSAAGSPRLATVAFGGGIIGAGFFLVALGATATAAYRPEETLPQIVRALNDLGVLIAAPAAAGFVALLAATGLVILRSSALADWLGWISIVGAVANLGAIGIIFTQDGAFAPDGFIGLLLPILGFLVPVAALSIVISQNVGSGGLVDRARGAVDRVTP
jgi:hypothetical protein